MGIVIDYVLNFKRDFAKPVMASPTSCLCGSGVSAPVKIRKRTPSLQCCRATL